LNKKAVPKKALDSLVSFSEFVQKEFQVGIIEAILYYDKEAEDYVSLESASDLHSSNKFKIYTEQSILTLHSDTRSREEKELRIHLAAAYRLCDLFGMSELIYSHITVAVPGEHAFLINPFGMLFSEITASSLVKLDIEGNILDPGSTKYGVNRAGYVIHSAIHKGRQDVKSIMHTHSLSGVAVSCMKQGLMQNLCQNSHIVGPVSYHDYEGIAVSLEERERLVADLGPENRVLILRNHGLLTCGSTVSEAFLRMFSINKACDIQVKALSAGLENVIYPDPKTYNSNIDIAMKFNPEGLGIKEFNGLLRHLDRIDPSYKM